MSNVHVQNMAHASDEGLYSFLIINQKMPEKKTYGYTNEVFRIRGTFKLKRK